MDEIIDTLGTNDDGCLSHDRYEAVKETNEEWKKLFAVEFGEGDNELRKQGEKWWPFSDR